MGQEIAVQSRAVGDVAMFRGDRTLTGQDGAAYASAAEAAAARTGPPAALAGRIFAADTAVDHVFVGGNEVIVRRPGGWSNGALEAVEATIAGLFVYYHDGAPSGDDAPFGGQGRLVTVQPAAAAAPSAPFTAAEMDDLRAEHYNAEIVYLRRAHDRLWIFGVRPDGGVPDYHAGQYATLGLGYWEPRFDRLAEDLGREGAAKLARRSYSISSSILGPDDRLLPPQEEALEFYVVLVEADWRGQPAVLTPRLFLKGVGDRLYLGAKIAGRYRIDKVDDRDADVLFVSTGTGEAPHNRMLLELLRRGHRGRLAGICTVRYRRDLAYLDVHRRLERMYPDYRYLPLTTREPENEGAKVYVQDLLESGRLEAELGIDLDPRRSHVFLCGHPGMIGLPSWENDVARFPEPKGMAEALVRRGFTLDRARTVGNVHYEEYW